jgi:NAD(P)-dependent dehydrogenase (short-subunit alcohol dehydrogenase family)
MSIHFPAHYGLTLTPTIHHKIPANINPSSPSNALPNPFIAVVTGAGKGLGYHISLAYASAGASGISISSRTSSDLDALESEIQRIAKEAGRKIEVLKSICDTQSDDSIAALVDDVRKKWGGRVDAVVANAGVISKYITRPGDTTTNSNLPIGVVEDDDFERVLNINLLGVWRTAKAFVPLLRDTKDGAQTLICSTSLASHSVNSLLTPIAYNVSKLACNRLMEHVDADHREKDGIHAYALHPGAVVTPQTVGHKNGEVWGEVLSDDEGLVGAVCVWLSRAKRAWLSGRYVSSNWDVEELEGMREKIENSDMLKVRMVV